MSLNSYKLFKETGFLHPKYLRQFKDRNKIVKDNALLYYCNWVTENHKMLISKEVWDWLFYECPNYVETFNYLIENNEILFKLSFMAKDTLESLKLRLKIRLELFNRVPSATNMLLAYNLIEEITLRVFSESNIDLTNEVNKTIDRFDKCKALALGTKIIGERRTAFERSLEFFKKLTKVEI